MPHYLYSGLHPCCERRTRKDHHLPDSLYMLSNLRRWLVWREHGVSLSEFIVKGYLFVSRTRPLTFRIFGATPTHKERKHTCTDVLRYKHPFPTHVFA